VTTDPFATGRIRYDADCIGREVIVEPGRRFLALFRESQDHTHRNVPTFLLIIVKRMVPTLLVIVVK
jgi:hypothetical protein